MSVHKDKKRGTWYFVVRVDGKQYKRRSAKWTLKRHAVEAEREFLSNHEAMLMASNDITFEELAERYVEYTTLHRKLSTVDNLRRGLKVQINPFFGKMKIKNINLGDVERFQRYLLDLEFTQNGVTKKYSNSSLAAIQSMTRSIFDYATKHRLLLFNPFNQVETVQRNEVEELPRITIITLDEYNKFYQQIKSDDDNDNSQILTDQALFNTLYWCGLRIGEALALNIEDFNVRNKTLMINKTYDSHNQIVTITKTGNNRLIDVPDKCWQSIKTLIDSYEEYDHLPNFPLFGLTQRYSKSSLDRRKSEYIKLSGVPYFTFHELRHTHVSTLIQIGMRDIDISKRLGHGVEMVNETYGHLFPKDKENMMNKLNKL